MGQFMDGKAAVADEDDPATWQPEAKLQCALPGPNSQQLMAPAASAVGSLGRGKQRQDRQGFDQAGPRHRGERHEAQPAQCAGLDEMAVTGAYRITVYPPCIDPVSPSAFDGVFHTDDNRAIGHEPFDHNVQQPPGDSAGAPSGATENLVIAC